MVNLIIAVLICTFLIYAFLMITTIDKAGFDFLANEEGLVLHPYLDSRQIPTIGIGMTYYPGGRKVTMQDEPITVQQAHDYLNQISYTYSNAVASPSLNQNQFNALFSLCYNIGAGAYKASTVRRLVVANPDDPAIAAAFELWHTPNLMGRRKREVAMYFG